MSVVAFGFINLKEYLKITGVFFGVTCLYAGIMTVIWKLLKPNGMVINNSVVYFDISAVALIFCTVIFYFCFMFLARIFASNGSMAEICDVILRADGREVHFDAILDTGNSVSDVFGNSEIIIADKSVAISLFENIDININNHLKNRYRVIPLSTVSGADMLDGFRCDSMTAILNKEIVNLKNPVIAVSKTSFDSNYSAILNPKIFRNVGEEKCIKNLKKL
jgi:stage II sporulation protein GA (sporulation sigma-E factor processing peptidase)